MQCANCKKDFKETQKVGCYTRQCEHFMQPYRLFGMSCPNCGFHNTIVQVPLQVPFTLENKYLKFPKLNEAVENFREEAQKILGKKDNNQSELFIEEY